ncbi:MAG: TlpA disulfide reductase family protein [Rhodocyclales bacterium]|nr:TlpA disulfide reductase family protein [Rhodocyclales bacterium]
MMHRCFFALAAAPPIIFSLLLPAAYAAPTPAAVLKAVAPRAVPATVDSRLAQILAAHKGKPVLVNFWATWCEPCREEMPALARLAARWKTKGLVVQTIAVADNVKLVEDFLWEASAELPVLHDREQTISRAWGARVLPTTVVLDRRHRIVLRGQGAIDWDAPAIDKQLKKLIN